MRKYIQAYNIPNKGVVGVDVDSWSGHELSGNEPIIISLTSSISGYNNITSFQNWLRYCDDTHHSIRLQMEYLYNETTWENLSLEDKKIVAKYFLVDKTKRDEVLTQQEQDDNNYFKIYDLVSEDVFIFKNITNKFITPKSIDYKKEIDGRLHPKYTFDSKGWLTQCEYFRNLEISQNQQNFTIYTYSDPILLYTATYSIKPDGYVGYRTVTRKWYRLDGTLDTDAKITVKYYEPLEARKEAIRRRQNLINNLIIETVGLIMMTNPNELTTTLIAEKDAIPFMEEISVGISKYYEYGNTTDTQGNPCKLIQDITTSQYTRLNAYVPGTNDTVTIRQYIISRLM